MAFECDDALARFHLPVRGALTGDYDVIHQWVLSRPVVHETQSALSSGNNTLTPSVPLTSVKALVLIPPATVIPSLGGVVDTWTLKGVGGDTGVVMQTTGPVVLSGYGNVGLIVINATTGGYTINLRWIG